jgi:hypothetical protein
LDHLGRLDEDGLREGEAQGLGGLHVDDQVEPGRLLHGDVRWLGPLQNLVQVGRSPPEARSELLSHPAVRSASALFCLGAPDRQGADANVRFLDDHDAASFEQPTHVWQVGKQERYLKNRSALGEPSEEDNRRGACASQGEKGAEVGVR